jgi:hypothetical protein
LNCWRWERNAGWPAVWEEIRRRPLTTAVRRLIKPPVLALREQWQVERKLFPFAALGNPMHHALLCVTFWRMKRRAGHRSSDEGKKPTE